MAKTRREFTPEFKREAVALLESSGPSRMKGGAELGIQPSMLHRWRTVLMESSPQKRPAGLPGSAIQALKRELTTCLRTGRALRVPRARCLRRGQSLVTPEVLISERPAEVEDRAVPGHWEGGLILGLKNSAIGTLVERTTRFPMRLHLPPVDGHGATPPAKNGPALAGHGAAAVREAITGTIARLPERRRRSLTWDQGAEHARLRIDAGL